MGHPLSQWLFHMYAVRENVTMGRGIHVGPGTIISSASGLTIGDGVYIGKGCTIQVSGSIGRGTLIANRVGIVGRLDHDLSAIDFPIGFAPWIGRPGSGLLGMDQVVIGEDVWIGYGAVVLSGVHGGSRSHCGCRVSRYEGCPGVRHRGWQCGAHLGKPL